MENEDLYKSDVVVKAKEELKKVSERLSVHSLGGSGEKIYSITTSFPLKGNKNILNALIELGWETTKRFKVRTDGSWSRNQYDGYEMHQGMAKYFR